MKTTKLKMKVPKAESVKALHLSNPFKNSVIIFRQ